ncbi:hypothetical protein [Mesorhizobium sp. A623]
MSDNVLPQTKHPKLIVVVAFDRGEDGTNYLSTHWFFRAALRSVAFGGTVEKIHISTLRGIS